MSSSSTNKSCFQNNKMKIMFADLFDSQEGRGEEEEEEEDRAARRDDKSVEVDKLGASDLTVVGAQH